MTSVAAGLLDALYAMPDVPDDIRAIIIIETGRDQVAGLLAAATALIGYDDPDDVAAALAAACVALSDPAGGPTRTYTRDEISP
jgi:hypothetical protein